jgi:hypothetical protein
MKRVIGILMLTILAINVFSQEFEVPKNYVFSNKEDYTKYEADILKSIHWLTNTPIQTQPEKRKEVNAFVMVWLTGSPNVSVEIKTEIVNFMDPNPELLMIFICGWTKYSIETKDYKNKIIGNQKGIEAVIDFYTKNRENLKKDKNVEKYIKMKDKGTLEEYITKNA